MTDTSKDRQAMAAASAKARKATVEAMEKAFEKVARGEMTGQQAMDAVNRAVDGSQN